MRVLVTDQARAWPDPSQTPTVVPPGCDPCDPYVHPPLDRVVKALWLGDPLPGFRVHGFTPLNHGCLTGDPRGGIGERRNKQPVKEGEWCYRSVRYLSRWGWWGPFVSQTVVVDDKWEDPWVRGVGGWGRPKERARRSGRVREVQGMADTQLRVPRVPGVYPVSDLWDENPDMGRVVVDGPVWLQLPVWWQEFLSWLFWTYLVEVPMLGMWWTR